MIEHAPAPPNRSAGVSFCPVAPSCLQGERYRTGSYARSEPGGYQARNQHSEDVRGASVMSGV